MPEAESVAHRSGFVAIVGRPNAGKSTLVNAMVGQAVAITSSKPQTTRRAIRGIVRRPGLQLVLVDTPGLHRPRTLLGERLNQAVGETLGEVDAVVMCLPAIDRVGPGDRFIAAQLPSGVPLIAAVTKADLVGRGPMAAHLMAVSELAQWAEIVPVSAVTDFQVADLIEIIGRFMPVGPDYFPDGEASDQPVEITLAEFVRQAALEDLREELPHSLAVVIEEIIPPNPLDQTRTIVQGVIYVERDSQKGIMIGRGGQRLAAIGRQARRQMVALLGGSVHLDLHVKVAKDWQRDPKLLHKLGF